MMKEENKVIKVQYNGETKRLNTQPQTYTELTDMIQKEFPRAIEVHCSIQYVDSDRDVITVTTDADLREAYVQLEAAKQDSLTFVLCPPLNVPSPLSPGPNQAAVGTSVKRKEHSAPEPGQSDSSSVSKDLKKKADNKAEKALRVESPQEELTLDNLMEKLGKMGIHASKEEVLRAGSELAKNERVHENITCKHCLIKPIVGVRYKCTVCSDYDLCEKCEAQNIHSEHTLEKIKTTRQRRLQTTAQDASAFPSGLLDFIAMYIDAFPQLGELFRVLSPDPYPTISKTGQRPESHSHPSQPPDIFPAISSDPPSPSTPRPALFVIPPSGPAPGPSLHASKGASPEIAEMPAAHNEGKMEDTKEEQKISSSPVPAEGSAASKVPKTHHGAPQYPPIGSRLFGSAEKRHIRFSNTNMVKVLGGDYAHTLKLASDPNVFFTAIWELQNGGTLPWPEEMWLTKLGGRIPFDTLVVKEKLEPGATMKLEVPIEAPKAPGYHTLNLGLQTPSGEHVGQMLTVELLVPDSQGIVPSEDSVYHCKAAELEADMLGTFEACYNAIVEAKGNMDIAKTALRRR